MKARALLPLVVLALVAAPMSGCLADVRERADGYADRIRSEPLPPQDFIEVFDDFVAPQHDASYAVPVQAGARTFLVTINLTVETPTPQFPLAPAQIQVSIENPNATVVGGPITLDPQNPNAVLNVTDLSAVGEYALRVTGRGLSGNDYGARYTAEAVVSYR